jgi:ATP-dependent Clp protease adaptor protein ClpS
MPVATPDIQTTTTTDTRLAPRWHVVLLNDEDHTYDYVIEMLSKLFDHSVEVAFRMACEVHRSGRAIVDTTSRERAELKQEQIHGYGRDPRLPNSRGSMTCELEPVH